MPDLPVAHRLDYARLRRQIPIRRVLEELSFTPLKARGDQWRGACPLCASGAGGQRCFSAHLTKNAFRCFRCAAAGNQLDLWVAFTGLPLRMATLDLCSRLGVDPTDP